MKGPAALAQVPVQSQTLAEVEVWMRVRVRVFAFRSPSASPTVPVPGPEMGPGQLRMRARGSDYAMEAAAGTRAMAVGLASDVDAANSSGERKEDAVHRCKSIRDCVQRGVII